VNNFLGQLNLTPQERRIVVIIFLVVIIVLNLLFVWPHFGEWGSINKQLAEMRNTIANYNRVIDQDLNKTNGYKVQVSNLSRLEGGSVQEHPVDPQIQLRNTISTQERKTGVVVSSYGSSSSKTNEFFEEISTGIEVESQEPQLVNFLYNMGMDPAMIRVARLDLKPADANRYQLKGQITLTANYTKKPPTAVSPATPAATKTVAVNKPAPVATNKQAVAVGNKPAGAPGGRAPGPPAPAPNAKRPTGPPTPGMNKQPPPIGKPNMPNRPNRTLPGQNSAQPE
jgi:hypothetical protein